jgi:hypothetical protein
MDQVDNAKNALQYSQAQEQAAAADRAYQIAFKAWRDFYNQLGH